MSNVTVTVHVSPRQRAMAERAARAVGFRPGEVRFTSEPAPAPGITVYIGGNELTTNNREAWAHRMAELRSGCGEVHPSFRAIRHARTGLWHRITMRHKDDDHIVGWRTACGLWMVPGLGRAEVPDRWVDEVPVCLRCVPAVRP